MVFVAPLLLGTGAGAYLTSKVTGLFKGDEPETEVEKAIGFSISPVKILMWLVIIFLTLVLFKKARKILKGL